MNFKECIVIRLFCPNNSKIYFNFIIIICILEKNTKKLEIYAKQLFAGLESGCKFLMKHAIKQISALQTLFLNLFSFFHLLGHLGMFKSQLNINIFLGFRDQKKSLTRYLNCNFGQKLAKKQIYLIFWTTPSLSASNMNIRNCFRLKIHRLESIRVYSEFGFYTNSTEFSSIPPQMKLWMFLFM